MCVLSSIDLFITQFILCVFVCVWYWSVSGGSERSCTHTHTPQWDGWVGITAGGVEHAHLCSIFSLVLPPSSPALQPRIATPGTFVFLSPSLRNYLTLSSSLSVRPSTAYIDFVILIWRFCSFHLDRAIRVYKKQRKVVVVFQAIARARGRPPCPCVVPSLFSTAVKWRGFLSDGPGCWFYF